MTGSVVTPYLTFSGRCEEAIAFYGKAVGAKLEMLMLFKDSPEAPPPGMLQEGFENKVMHASFTIGQTRVMASDGCDDKTKLSGFNLALSVATEAEARSAFDGLSAGGQVSMPLTKTFWSPCFGMLTDRFGVSWMVMVPGESPV